MPSNEHLEDWFGLDNDVLRGVYRELDALVEQAVEQCAKGWAVDVEEQQADLAKSLVRRFHNAG